MANLPHVTAQPDLLPWNATGCCARDKKRQRLKLQGGNTPWTWRAAQLRQGKKNSQGFHTHPFFSCHPLPQTSLHHEHSSNPLTLGHTCAHAQFSPDSWGGFTFDHSASPSPSSPRLSPVRTVVPVLPHS